SSIRPLPSFSASPSFSVSWAGDDGAGSGIATFDVFVSEDGGSFTPFLESTTETSADFAGVAGHRYVFYSVATDNVGHRESTPTAGQAATQVLTGVSLQTDPTDTSKTALIVVGTDAPETITLKPVKQSGVIRIDVRINNVSQGTFAPTGHIFVYGQGG